MNKKNTSGCWSRGSWNSNIPCSLKIVVGRFGCCRLYSWSGSWLTETENGFMEPKYKKRFRSGDEGHPFINLWQHDDWCLGIMILSKRVIVMTTHASVSSSGTTRWLSLKKPAMNLDILYFANVVGAFLYLKTFCFVFHILHGYPYSVWFVLNAHLLEHFYRIMIGVIISYSCIVAVIFFVLVMHMDTCVITLLHPHIQCIRIHFLTCFSASKRAVLALAGKSQKI